MLRDNRNRIIAAAVLVAISIWLSVAFSGPQALEVTFFDVGDGLCVFVYTPSGRSILVDCGSSSWRDNSDIGRRLVAPYIQSRGLDSIDVAVLTHPHADHMSGYPGLLDLKPARLILECGADYDSPEHVEFKKAAKRSNAKRNVARRGQVIDMGDGVRADILHPAGVHYLDLNDNSIVIRLIYKNVNILLAADASKDAEEEILEFGVDVHAQVLQVGHHGSRTATTPKWLAAVNPKIAVISCSKRSRHNFPSRKVTQRLDSFGVRTCTTAKCGAITISTDGDTIKVRTRRNSFR